MLFGNDRNSLRKMYQDAWAKAQSAELLTPLEHQIAEVLREHPEYHALVVPSKPSSTEALQRDFHPEQGESNPFLHLSLHLAVRDQLQTNRPAGIRDVYTKLTTFLSPHDAEHVLSEHMAEALWRAQRSGSAPDEQHYLAQLRAFLREKGSK